jgi:hypothetical protein
MYSERYDGILFGTGWDSGYFPYRIAVKLTNRQEGGVPWQSSS